MKEFKKLYEENVKKKLHEVSGNMTRKIEGLINISDKKEFIKIGKKIYNDLASEFPDDEEYIIEYLAELLN